jgi:hypothetical protein
MPIKFAASWRGFVVDLAVYAFILSTGAFQLTHYLHTADFVTDVSYPDLARSLAQEGAYEIRFLPQTTLPPGLPLILAVVGRVAGFTPAVMFGVICVSGILGLLAAYELLKRIGSSGLAATACLLLGSSPALFGFNTVVVFPEMPYLLASMVVLLVALRIDRSVRKRVSIFLILFLSVALSLAVLIRSVGLALIIGLITWCAASLMVNREAAQRRLWRFAIPLALGIATQAGWSLWAHRHQVSEWQLPGYPQSYLSQLELKDGQHPELGLANLSDIPARIERNLFTRTAGFVRLMIRRYLSPFWSSPAIAGVALLALIGLLSSLRNGGQLHDWYFLWYECIFLVWPWDYRDRFVIPIVPLACLYLWRGVVVVSKACAARSKVAGCWLVGIGSILSLISIGFALGLIALPATDGHARGDHLQPVAAAMFWSGAVMLGISILGWERFYSSSAAAQVRTMLNWAGSARIRLSAQLATVVTILFLVASGTATQVAVGRARLHPDTTQQDLYPEIEASEWIQAHEPARAVIMAREPEFVAHYTHRRVVWLPPISKPKVLMAGIERHHVGTIVVAHHSNSYWIPAEDTCFQALLQEYPGMFRLSHRGPDNWVYDVVTPLNGLANAH